MSVHLSCRSTWKSNPFTRGSYSYLAAGVDINLHDTLRQPVPTPEVNV